MPSPASRSAYLGVKRMLDIVFAAVGLLVVAPVIGILWVLIRLRMGSPAIFSQLRPGRNAKVFTLYKFRTMNATTGPDGKLLSDAERLTRFGKLIRQLSLDELPQLWNVLRGDMSLIGPRPLLVEYLARYSAHQARRHEIRPGITGWAQVNGRNALEWEQRFELDVWYVDHVSPLLDLKILALTFAKVLNRRGISAQGHATSPEFTGAKPREIP